MVEGQGAAGLQEYLATLQPDPTVFLFVLGSTYIGTALTTVMSLLFISSVFAALLAFHNAVARYLYALGREGLVPATLGRTHAKHLSPHIGSLSQSILAVIVVLIFVVTQQDPVLALFTWLTQLGTLAIIVLMALASFAVVAFFARHRDLDSNMLRTMVAPLVGGLAMSVVAIYAASQFGLLIGNPESPLRWILPALILGRGGSRSGCRLQSEEPLTRVVRPNGSASRYRAGRLNRPPVARSVLITGVGRRRGIGAGIAAGLAASCCLIRVSGSMGSGCTAVSLRAIYWSKAFWCEERPENASLTTPKRSIRARRGR